MMWKIPPQDLRGNVIVYLVIFGLLAVCGIVFITTGTADRLISQQETPVASRDETPLQRATPGPCTPLPEGMTATAELERAELHVEAEGVPMGEEVTVFVQAHTEEGVQLLPMSTTTRPTLGAAVRITSSPVRAPDALSYTVKLVHSAGVACIPVTQPE